MPRDPTPKKRRRAHPEGGPAAATMERPDAPFRAIVELAPDALVVSDSLGHITLVNRQTEELFGYTRDALLGQPVEVLLPERFHAAHGQHRAHYLAAPRTRPMGTYLQLWGRRSDGSEFPVAVSLSPLPAADAGKVFAVVSTIRDLSERKRLEAARTAAEVAGQELRRLQGIIDTALAHPELDDLLDAVLERLQEMLEADNAAILLLEEGGQHLIVHAARGPEADVVGGVRVPVGEGFAGRIAATRAPLAVVELSTYPVVNPVLHNRLRSAAGVSLVVDGRLIGVLHIGSAIPRRFTEEEMHLLQLIGERVALAVDHARAYAREQQAHAEAEVRATELEAIIQAMPEAVALTDADGRIVRANAAFHALYATAARPEFLELPLEERTRLLEVRDLAGRPLTAEDLPLWRILRGNPIPTTDPVEMRVRALDGRELVVSATGAPLRARDRDARTAGAVFIARDVTERKRLERDRTELLGLVAHDLGNPLTAIKTQVHLLQRRLARQEDLPDPSLHSLDSAVRRMERLVGDLRAVEGIEAGQLALVVTSCDLAQLCHDEADAVRTASGRDIILVGSDSPVMAQVDRERIGQVLGNLLSNALKYSSADRPVTLALAIEEVPGEREVGAAKDDGGARRRYARVAVRDEGPGIPPAGQAHLFERFYRVPGIEMQYSLGHSLGLGLYIARQLIERHGGQIGVESAVGHGSTFWFTLPLAAQNAVP